jgi:lipoteichoic acid synthase
LNKYLNAIRHSDQAFGQLMEYLYKNNLEKETLVIVVGDHGEAFKQHGQIGHATKLYEENIKIPLILINPAFKSERKDMIGGMVDVAPTIFHLINQSAPEAWQGSSLFSKNHKNSAYFFCPWSDYLFGARSGDYKYIYDALNNETEIYDLKKDPEEKDNLASKRPDIADKSFKKVAAWAQYQDKFVKKLFLQRTN